MKYLPALLSIFIAQGAGIIGSFFTASNIQTWYTTLSVPTWNPPNWVFGPVWTTLYTLMGIAAYLVWRERHVDGRVRFALGVYGVNLVLNALWSIIFFGMHRINIALWELVLLDIFIVATLFLFIRIRTLAGILIIPYLLWALFATYLNYTLFLLN